MIVQFRTEIKLSNNSFICNIFSKYTFKLLKFLNNNSFVSTISIKFFQDLSCI